MKHTLFLLLLANWSLLYSQESETSKDTLSKPLRLANTILIDSAKLHKYREINASGAIIYESPSVNFDNISYCNASSSIRIRDNNYALLTLNGVPLSPITPAISIFNIESIEISKTSLETGTNFLNGSVNLLTIKPRFNQPKTINYEGGISVGRFMPTYGLRPQNFTGYLAPGGLYIMGEGPIVSNNIAIAKGKDNRAIRVAFSNKLASYETDFYMGKSKFIANSLSIDHIIRPSSNLNIATSLYFALEETKNSWYGNDYESYKSKLIFANISTLYKISDKLVLNTQVASVIGDLEKSTTNNIPLFGKISLKRKTLIGGKSQFETSVGYSYLNNKTRWIDLVSSSNTNSIYGSIIYDYSRKIKFSASICNEVYSDRVAKQEYYLVPALDIQVDLFNLLGISSIKKSFILFANYTQSNRESNFYNIKNKFEGGFNLAFFANRVELNACYFNSNSTFNYDIKNALYDWGGPRIKGDKTGEGVELQNSIKLIDAQKMQWRITNRFVWITTATRVPDPYEINLPIMKPFFPEYRYSLASDFCYKNFNFGFIIEGLKDKAVSVPNDYNETITELIAIRQINLMYKNDNLKRKAISEYSISLYIKNFNLFKNPSEYMNPPLQFESNYGISCSRMIGINLQMTF